MKVLFAMPAVDSSATRSRRSRVLQGASMVFGVVVDLKLLKKEYLAYLNGDSNKFTSIQKDFTKTP